MLQTMITVTTVSVCNYNYLLALDIRLFVAEVLNVYTNIEV